MSTIAPADTDRFVHVLNSLLRGEISAQETYEKALIHETLIPNQRRRRRIADRHDREQRGTLRIAGTARRRCPDPLRDESRRVPPPPREG